LKKIISALLSLLLVASMLSACGSKDETGDKNTTKETTNQNPVTGENDEDGKPSAGTNTTDKNGPAGTVGAGVTYLGTTREMISYPNQNGFAYRADNSMYGVRSADGSFDSGAIYYSVDTEGKFFTVQTGTYADPNNLDSINCTGVIDANGKVLVPAQYALVKRQGDNYLRAYKVTGVTTDEDNYLVRLSQNLFSLTAAEGDVLYTGQWCIYDTRTGKEVPGVSGTTNVSIYQNGDVLTYTENGQKFCKNAAGEDIPLDARLFSDGSYIPKGENAVYDANKQKRFDIGADGFSLSSWQYGYYTMNKYQDGSIFAVADETGKICSTTFTERVNVIEGGLLDVYDGVYDMQGKKILDKPCQLSAYRNGSWLIRDNEKNVYLVESDYQVTPICQLDAEGVYEMDRTDFAVSKEEGDTDYYYSVAEKKFVEGEPVAQGVSEKKTTGDNKVLIDMATGAELLSGYTRYNVVVDEQGVCYIYAYMLDQNYNRINDIFKK